MILALDVKVVTAESGAKALEIFEERKDEFAVILLDIMMPGMSGIETLERMRKIDPDVKAILISGYAENELDVSHPEIGELTLLRKPFDAADLHKTLVDVLRG